jgi:hypothetical protein
MTPMQKPGGNSEIQRPTLNYGYAKGGNVKAASYAKGGLVGGTTRNFVKGEPDPFRGVAHSVEPGTQVAPEVVKMERQDYEDGKKSFGKDKSLKPIKPRK